MLEDHTIPLEGYVGILTPGGGFVELFQQVTYPGTFPPAFELTASMPKKKKRKRQKKSTGQLTRLEREFSITPYPSKDTRYAIARDIGLTARQVQVWFQNNRAKVQEQRRKYNPDFSFKNEQQPTRSSSSASHSSHSSSSSSRQKALSDDAWNVIPDALDALRFRISKYCDKVKDLDANSNEFSQVSVKITQELNRMDLKIQNWFMHYSKSGISIDGRSWHSPCFELLEIFTQGYFKAFLREKRLPSVETHLWKLWSVTMEKFSSAIPPNEKEKFVATLSYFDTKERK